MIANREMVILVDESDREIGTEEKLAAHREGGKLHRAFSVFIFRSDGCLMLQRRSLQKYHFGGLWSNTCCGHPRPGERIADAARRRLREEMGFEVPLEALFQFLYRATDAGSGLTEHELDHVFVGRFEAAPIPDMNEIDDWRWQSIDAIRADLIQHPSQYSPWLAKILETMGYRDRFQQFLRSHSRASSVSSLSIGKEEA